MIKKSKTFTTPCTVKDVLREAIAFHDRYGLYEYEFRLVAFWGHKASRWHNPEEVKEYIEKHLKWTECGQHDEYGWVMEMRNVAMGKVRNR